MDERRLRALVAEAFAATGMATPGWPNPHPGGRQPLDEEYSRCPDPGKYRILAARAEAWVLALTELGLATAEVAVDPSAVWRDEVPRPAPERATWVHPRQNGALPLLVALFSIQGAADVGLCLGAGDRAVLVLTTPDCGCDACDSGSESLLEQLDEYVWAVVSGALVHLAAKDSVVVATGSGWSASGRYAGPPHGVPALVDAVRAGRPLPRRHRRDRVVHGAAWG